MLPCVKRKYAGLKLFWRTFLHQCLLACAKTCFNLAYSCFLNLFFQNGPTCSKILPRKHWSGEPSKYAGGCPKRRPCFYAFLYMCRTCMPEIGTDGWQWAKGQWECLSSLSVQKPVDISLFSSTGQWALLKLGLDVETFDMEMNTSFWKMSEGEQRRKSGSYTFLGMHR